MLNEKGSVFQESHYTDPGSLFTWSFHGFLYKNSYTSWIVSPIIHEDNSLSHKNSQ